MPRIEGKTVALLVSQEFEDIEVLYPVLRLNEEGANIVVATLQSDLHTRPALANKPITGRFGSVIPFLVLEEGKRYSHGAVDELECDDFDCVMIPGGFSPDFLRINQGVLKLLRTANEEGKIIAAICHGPWVLVSAGLVKGKRATSYAAVRDDLINAGAHYVDVPAVRDGNIITGRAPDDLPEFCQFIIAALASNQAIP